MDTYSCDVFSISYCLIDHKPHIKTFCPYTSYGQLGDDRYNDAPQAGAIKHHLLLFAKHYTVASE
jgi:hypothetical protein